MIVWHTAEMIRCQGRMDLGNWSGPLRGVRITWIGVLNTGHAGWHRIRNGCWNRLSPPC